MLKKIWKKVQKEKAMLEVHYFGAIKEKQE